MPTITKTAADFQTQLANPVSAGDTTATLVSANDDDGNVLAAGTYGFTIDLGTSEKEYIVAALSGTSLSAISSISRQGVVSSGFGSAHRRGAKVAITDWVIIKRLADLLDGTTQFDADTPLGYDDEPTLSDPNSFATVQYVLDTAFGGSFNFDRQIITSQVAGETVSAGKIIYLDTTTNQWLLASSAAIASANKVKLGVAQGTALAGNIIPNGVLLSGLDSNQSGLSAGSLVYLSTSGGVSGSAGTVPRVLGVARSTTSFFFDPNFRSQPSQNEADALAAADSPTSLNPFLTASSFSGATPKTTITTFTSSGTWTKPAGLAYVIVEVQGGGGGGGNSTGSGGSAGGYSRKSIAAASLGATETVTIGAAGGANANGGNSSFGSHCSASGGQANGGTPGIGSSGDLNIQGGTGNPPFAVDVLEVGGQGGNSLLGFGGPIAVVSGSSTSNGTNATGYGAGGGGASDNGAGTPTGGSGTAGIVIVHEFYDQDLS